MKMKKFLALLCALCMVLASGCSFLGGDPNDGDDDRGNEKPNSHTRDDSDSDGKDDYSETGKAGLSMQLDDSGNLSIIRSDAGNVPMGADGTWTIFVYLCGTDLESSGGFATMDMLEMIYASTGSDVKFVVQTGGTQQWQNEAVTSDGLYRYMISDGEINLVDEQRAASMGSGDTLAEFLKWGVANYPAAKMGLVFWNHGGGNIAGVCFDELNGCDSLSLTEINSALSEAAASMTDKFELIGFDACLMGTLETANILATYARYMCGSEETEPGYGWDYTAIGSYLGSNPAADGAMLGKVICDSFYDGCAQINAESAATLSVIDLSAIDEVIISFNDYAKALYEISANNAVLSEVVRNVKYADNFGGNNKAEGYTNMVDLAGLIISGNRYAQGADRVLSALGKAVVYKVNGYEHKDACGLATYYPLELQGTQELKIFSSIAVSPYYLSFVDRTIYGNTYDGDTSSYSNSSILDIWSESDTDDGYWDSYGACEATGQSSLIVFYDEPQLLTDGTYAFSLTDESLAYTASVQANVYMLSEDMQDIIELGISADIQYDWENGIFADNFDGYWFSLPDGQILAVYLVAECEGYDVYTSPIMLNGEVTNLRITHDYMTGSVTIDGVWDGIDENGMAARNVYELKSGDSIIPLYYAMAIDSDDEYYYYGSEYIFAGEPRIYFDLMYDGEYLYGFTIDDIFGDFVITDFVNFTIDGDSIYFSET
ncbi:MAG: clostripain-related cysteine peptidase [Oscillospiraceae bacterium]